MNDICAWCDEPSKGFAEWQGDGKSYPSCGAESHGFSIRWRDDASGYVARYAGRTASNVFRFEEDAERVRREMPNGSQAEVVGARPRTPNC